MTTVYTEFADKRRAQHERLAVGAAQCFKPVLPQPADLRRRTDAAGEGLDFFACQKHGLGRIHFIDVSENASYSSDDSGGCGVGRDDSARAVSVVSALRGVRNDPR